MSSSCRLLICLQAQKFSQSLGEVEDDDLGEDTVLLESPLDKIEPYQLFRATLMSKFSTFSVIGFV